MHIGWIGAQILGDMVGVPGNAAVISHMPTNPIKDSRFQIRHTFTLM